MAFFVSERGDMYAKAKGQHGYRDRLYHWSPSRARSGTGSSTSNPQARLRQVGDQDPRTPRLPAIPKVLEIRSSAQQQAWASIAAVAAGHSGLRIRHRHTELVQLSSSKSIIYSKWSVSVSRLHMGRAHGIREGKPCATQGARPKSSAGLQESGHAPLARLQALLESLHLIDLPEEVQQ